MQITDLSVEQKILPLFRLGFRPFFLLGSAFSMIAIVLWLLVLNGSINLSLYGGGSFWHIHEMIYGFGCAIIVGFLLTAVQNWTGVRGVSGKPLALLVTIWFLARFLLVFPELTGHIIVAVIDISFLPLAAYLLSRPILAIKQYRNLIFLPILLMFTLINLFMHLTVLTEISVNFRAFAYASVCLVTLLMSIMAGRVAPMFTANGTQTPKVNPLSWLEQLCTASLVLLVITYLVSAITPVPALVTGVLFIVAGVAQGYRWFRWRPWITLNVPLLWSIHFSLLFIWWALLTLGLGYISQQLPLNDAWHLLTIGGMAGLILAMISRVSLGHTGRMLQPPKAMSVAYLSIFIAALIRGFGPWLSSEHSLMFYDVSGALWLLGFSLFSVYYGPMLLTARIDGRPG